MNDKQKAAKDYLSKSFFIDQNIQSKLDQIQTLNDLATNATASFSDMPGCPNRNKSRMEDIIVKIVDLQSELGLEIEKLIDTRKIIHKSIESIDDPQGRLVLEERYLCSSKWDAIADLLGCSLRQIFRIHDEMLNKLDIF